MLPSAPIGASSEPACTSASEPAPEPDPAQASEPLPEPEPEHQESHGPGSQPEHAEDVKRQIPAHTLSAQQEVSILLDQVMAGSGGLLDADGAAQLLRQQLVQQLRELDEQQKAVVELQSQGAFPPGFGDIELVEDNANEQEYVTEVNHAVRSGTQLVVVQDPYPETDKSSGTTSPTRHQDTVSCFGDLEEHPHGFQLGIRHGVSARHWRSSSFRDRLAAEVAKSIGTDPAEITIGQARKVGDSVKVSHSIVTGFI